MYKYHTLVVGGTFDHLHEGHKALLRFAFSLGETVYVTMTSDAYTAVYKPHAASFEKREEVLRLFLTLEGLIHRAKLLPIDDVYGITSSEGYQLEAIAVTPESLQGAGKVNEKRKALGFPQLQIEVMPLVRNEAGIPLSSTLIREGMVSQKDIEIEQFKHKTLLLPQTLREVLRRPIGKVIQQISGESFDKARLIAIGDVTVRLLHEAGLLPTLSIIDFVVERKKQQESLAALGFSGDEKIEYAHNPAGQITPSLWQAIEKALAIIQNKSIIVVLGEEDLAVLPALLLAPEGMLLCYGQPGQGMVVVRVTHEAKKQALQLLGEFIVKQY